MRQVYEPVAEIMYAQCQGHSDRREQHARRQQEQEAPQEQQGHGRAVALPAAHVEVTGRRMLQQAQVPATLPRTLAQHGAEAALPHT